MGRYVLAIVATVACLVCFGCNSTPTEKYGIAVKAYDSVFSAAATAIENDWVTLDQAEAIGQTDEIVYGGLVEARARLAVDPNDPQAGTQLDGLLAIIQGMKAIAKPTQTNEPATDLPMPRLSTE